MVDHSSGSKVPGWIWLFTGTVLGVFITFLMRLSELQPPTPEARPAQQAGANQSAKAPTKYDFYEMLRNAEVPVTAPKNPPAAKVEENVEYLLQVASFSSPAEAEQVRAELLMLNLSSRIEASAAKEGKTWHRVIVGPFANRSQLAKAKDTLLSNRYDAMLLKRKRGG
jgi:cell division protein FtsN